VEEEFRMAQESRAKLTVRGQEKRQEFPNQISPAFFQVPFQQEMSALYSKLNSSTINVPNVPE
jgi:hypothetical protein